MVYLKGLRVIEWVELKKQIQRSQTSANIILDTLNKLTQHRAITSGLLNLQTAAFILLAIFMLPTIIPGTRGWLVAGTIALIIWRLLPEYLMMKSIQNLGETI